MQNDLLNSVIKQKTAEDVISPLHPKALKFSAHKLDTESENEKEKENNLSNKSSSSETGEGELINKMNNVNNNNYNVMKNTNSTNQSNDIEELFLNQIIEKTDNAASEWLNSLNKDEDKDKDKDNDKDKDKDKDKNKDKNKDKDIILQEQIPLEEKTIPTPIPDTTSEKSSALNYDILDKSTSSSGYTVSKAPNIVCKRHGQVYLGVERSKFKLVCKKCIELGLKSDLELIDNLDIENISDSEEEINCDHHPSIKGIFYCDDCKQFLCKECFAHSHRKHNSNLPFYMSTKVKEEIQKIISETQKIKPRLEDSLDEISKMNEKIKAIRENSLKIIKGTVDKISIVSKSKFDIIGRESDNIYLNLDKEVENVYNRLSGLQIKDNKYLAQVNEFTNKINQEVDAFKICREKKSKSALFKEIKKTIGDSENFMTYKIIKCISEVKGKKEEIEKAREALNKNMRIFESSIMTSIGSGMKNFSIVLRRFPKFSRKGLKYYKTSSVVLKVDHSVFLAGLGLCGLYVSSRKLEDKKAPLYNDINERGKIGIEVIISEEENKKNLIEENTQNNNKTFEKKNSEKHILYGAINRNDPTQLVYLKKAVFLKADVNYLITIVNLDENPMIDIWCGEVNKSALSSLTQSMRCNCSHTTFNFTTADGIESDFNEFNMGVVASLIYCKTD